MKLPHRRQFLHLAADAAALPAVSRIASAQTYPTRPVHLIVGYAAAGPSDINARLGSVNGYRSGSASHSSSRAGQVLPAILPPRRSCVRHRTATPSSRSARRK